MNVEDRKKILIEFHKQFSRHQWYRDVAIIENHPINMQTTLEIRVNYRPLFETESVLAFGKQVSLPIYFKVLE